MALPSHPGHADRNPMPRAAVVLVNLGTPDAPTAAALRRYLREFLSDPRVVEIPRALWWPILYGLILPLRASRSATKYAAIWTPEGSPLRVHTESQAQLLQQALAGRGHDVDVTVAMRYGEPSLPHVLDALHARSCERLLILPAYPQYSGTTTASVADAVFRHLQRCRNQPELRLVKHYQDHPGYIGALKQSVLQYWTQHGRPDKLLMSFHGIPRRTVELGDPYEQECHETARLLAQALGLAPDQYLVSFQSRFGRAEWLQPYTSVTLEQLARDGVGRVDVVCPGFISDCLETLEEIALEAKETFLHAGGKTFGYIPCLNSAPDWIEALADLAEQHLAGWSTAGADKMDG